MKQLKYIFLLLMFFVIKIDLTYAKEIVVITGNQINVRREANTNSQVIGLLYMNDELDLLDKTISRGNGCNDNWYKVSNSKFTGYICSTWSTIKEIEDVSIPTDKDDDKKEEVSDKEEQPVDFIDNLKKQGFPDSYIQYLSKIHEIHPKWKFNAKILDLDFNFFVDQEYRSNGLSLIEDTGRYIDGYKSVDSWSYNYYTNIFNSDFRGGGLNWYAANKQTISYYIDPRNFLNEKQLFMFETLSFDSSIHTVEGVKLMLKNTFMDNNYVDDAKTMTYAEAFVEAGKLKNISPYFLVSRVIQEVGAKGSTIISGTVSGYEGYYNFYNIKAAGLTASETIANGLKHAKEKGWNTKYKAIVGGAEFLARDYISIGQDTLYLQKWDVFGPMYTNHQYMQNIQAPSTESIKTFNGYNNIGNIDSELSFIIPVFKNMPSNTTLPNKGNPNNYLKNLSVNGSYLFNEPSNKLEYELNLDSSTNSITIAAALVASTSSVSGTGSVSLNSDTSLIPIKVTAGNGSVRTYNINITRTIDKALAISEILRLLDIKNDDNYIYGTPLNKDISEIKADIIKKEPKVVVRTYDKDNNEKINGKVASGDMIKIKSNEEEKIYQFVIYGDVNGDGEIKSSDYIMIKNHIMGMKILSDVELIYGDANKDGSVNSADYIAIKNHIMGSKTIEQ